jgi:hypothetical protein
MYEILGYHSDGAEDDSVVRSAVCDVPDVVEQHSAQQSREAQWSRVGSGAVSMLKSLELPIN